MHSQSHPNPHRRTHPCTHTHTHAHAQRHVIFIVFPRQQLFCESARILRDSKLPVLLKVVANFTVNC
jgi:hypothetical protein